MFLPLLYIRCHVRYAKCHVRYAICSKIRRNMGKVVATPLRGFNSNRGTEFAKHSYKFPVDYENY